MLYIYAFEHKKISGKHKLFSISVPLFLNSLKNASIVVGKYGKNSEHSSMNKAKNNIKAFYKHNRSSLTFIYL